MFQQLDELGVGWVKEKLDYSSGGFSSSTPKALAMELRNCQGNQGANGKVFPPISKS